ncbi:MAG: LytR/AlgR family response regulator transcription factor [Fibrobacterota bacterium]
MIIVILEDEKVSARRLKRMVCEALESSISECVLFFNYSDCKNYLTHNSADLLLLDLNINGEDGFKILRELQHSSFQTIVVSANTDRAIEAFELGITDFIAKPFDSRRLRKALNRFTGRSNRIKKAENLVIKNHGERQFISIRDIVYISGAGDYSQLHCSGDRHFLYSKSLETLRKMLPATFIRVHKSFIVDREKIAKIRVFGGGKYRALLSSGESIPVSRSKYKDLFSGE